MFYAYLSNSFSNVFLLVYSHLTDCVAPGNRVMIVGIYSIKRMFQKQVKNYYLTSFVILKMETVFYSIF